MALAAKSPAERLKLILELRRRILEKARELEEALPVVEEVVALSKERRRLKGVLEGLKREKEEHEKRLAELERKRRLLELEWELVDRKLDEIEARARGLTTSGALEARADTAQASTEALPEFPPSPARKPPAAEELEALLKGRGKDVEKRAEAANP
jgi:chromosome segregation ATPase